MKKVMREDIIKAMNHNLRIKPCLIIKYTSPMLNGDMQYKSPAIGLPCTHKYF
jgi:hypothetical protein